VLPGHFLVFEELREAQPIMPAIAKRRAGSRALLFSCVAAALLLFTGFAQSASAPDISFQDQAGNSQSLAAYRGKVAVANFWATWCLPCREEMPMLNKVAEKYGSTGVAFVAVSLDDSETRPKIPKFLAKKKITLPVWLGATPQTLKQLELGGILPATAILDRDGSIAFRIEGEASKKDITSRVDWLLSDRSGKQPKTLIKNY
jgi:thiol-disulfide isomerase/thioredoxin